MKSNPDQTVYPKTHGQTGGLTKRELFAAMAMQGMVNNSKVCINEQVAGNYAMQAVTAADQLIEELNK